MVTTYNNGAAGLSPLNDVADVDLIDRIEAGDEVAQSELLRRFAGLIRMVALEYAPDYSQVEDLEQECRIRLLQQLNRFDRSRTLRPWLTTVIRNCARNFRRSANRWRHSSMPETPLHPPSSDRETDVMAGDAEMAEVLRGMVNELPSIYRQVVVRRYFDEWPCEQIATDLHIPVGTVKNRLFRARQLLYDKLAEKADQN